MRESRGLGFLGDHRRVPGWEVDEGSPVAGVGEAQVWAGLGQSRVGRNQEKPSFPVFNHTDLEECRIHLWVVYQNRKERRGRGGGTDLAIKA